ncbi:hypothetical protein, conserved [Eimeria necatrix]|uniref:NOL1/NOP2/Sun domain family member 4 n=1 Tax=Eimeria necatrix TaxID=51315 RepID=U6MPY7_9EIME|nr:hypothetical protein, conserved [Eimeria necatrix]CDJ66292.1 hypothetical protein, conserved [Eimeria necatrix]
MSARGGASWSSTYSKQYGKDRWSNLLQALSEPPNQLAFVAPNISHSALRYLLRKQRLVPCIIPNCLTCSDNAPVKENDAFNTNTAATVRGSQTTAAPTDCNASDGPFSVPPDSTAEASSCPALHENNTESVAIVDDDHVIEEARTKTYFLDGASALAAFVLEARPGEVVLDMCAAPGGKSLIISSMMSQAKLPSYIIGNNSMSYEIDSIDNDDEAGGLLVCNDASRDRLARLQATLTKFLPPYATAGQRLQFSCADVCKGGAFERFAPYDRILLDAPCSSDRHLLRKGGSAVAKWSQGTPKAHAERQLKMLLIASKLLKKNGILLYTTCSLSELENDGVIDKFLKKAKGNVKTLPLFDGEWPAEVRLEGATANQDETTHENAGRKSGSALFSIEKLKHGYAMLPDVSRFGPMYFCRMQILGH